MKKSQLKAAIKPIVKECINEILLEQGLLSNIIAEVVKGVQPLHTQPSMPTPNKELAFQKQQLDEQRQELEYQDKPKKINSLIEKARTKNSENPCLLGMFKNFTYINEKNDFESYLLEETF